MSKTPTVFRLLLAKVVDKGRFPETVADAGAILHRRSRQPEVSINGSLTVQTLMITGIRYEDGVIRRAVPFSTNGYNRG
jgi:hypothetical protein